MRLKHLAALLPLLLSAPVWALPVTSEVLVLTSATEVTPSNTNGGKLKAIEIQNLGPNAIYCAFTSATAVVSKARMIAAKPASGPADSWAIDVWPGVKVYCIAATASQLTTAATIVSGLFQE